MAYKTNKCDWLINTKVSYIILTNYGRNIDGNPFSADFAVGVDVSEPKGYIYRLLLITSSARNGEKA